MNFSTPSTEPHLCANSNNPELADIFEGEAKPLLANCPDFIQSMACDLIQRCDEAPEPVIAAMLAVAAAAVGNRFRVATGAGHSVPAGFNAIIGHDQPRELDWLDSVAAPLAFRVYTMQAGLYRDKPSGIQSTIKTQERDLEQARKTDNPDPDLLAQAELDIARLRAHLAPSVILLRFAIDRIAEEIDRAFDQGLISLVGGSDPLDDFIRSTPAERRELTRLLNLGWAGKPLHLKGHEVPGAVTLLWGTSRSNLERWSDWRELHAGALPAPVLLLSSASEPRGGAILPPGGLWHRMIGQCFDLRVAAEQSKVYAFTDDARARIEAWDNTLVEKLRATHAGLAKHLAWLPMLARRIALLLELLNNPGAEMIGEPAARSSLDIVNALGRAHLQTLLAVLPPTEIGLTDSADRPDKSEIMLGKIREQGPISRRKLRRTYNDQRVGWFNETLDGLIRAGKVHGGDEALSTVSEIGSEKSGSVPGLA